MLFPIVPPSVARVPTTLFSVAPSTITGLLSARTTVIRALPAAFSVTTWAYIRAVIARPTAGQTAITEMCLSSAATGTTAHYGSSDIVNFTFAGSDARTFTPSTALDDCVSDWVAFTPIPGRAITFAIDTAANSQFMVRTGLGGSYTLWTAAGATDADNQTRTGGTYSAAITGRSDIISRIEVSAL